MLVNTHKDDRQKDQDVEGAPVGRRRKRDPTERQRGQARLGSEESARNTASAPSLSPLLSPLSPSRFWLFALALVVAVFLAYQPAWQGGLVWDDDWHVTRPELRSWQGLGEIWFHLGTTRQYYPLVHSLFWVEHKLWGDAVIGYHLVNIGLHALAAVMVAWILRRLAVPGAYLAAAIFALHPVHVESVAWIAELKNTLSAVFYLGAAIVYLRWRGEGRGQGKEGEKGRRGDGETALQNVARSSPPLPLSPSPPLVPLSCRVGPLPARATEQTGHGHFAGGAAGGCLVAAGPVVVAARRTAIGALFRSGGGRWCVRRLGRAHADGSPRGRVRADRCRALPAGRSGCLVLSRQAFLARQPDLHLPSLADQPGRLAAIRLPGGLRCCCWPYCGVWGDDGAARWPGCCSLSGRCCPRWDSATSLCSSIRTWPITSSTWRAWGSLPLRRPVWHCCWERKRRTREQG